VNAASVFLEIGQYYVRMVLIVWSILRGLRVLSTQPHNNDMLQQLTWREALL